jgi:hypothetical protein
MPLVRAANNLSLMAQDGVLAIIHTDPYALGGMNYGELMVNLEVLDGTGGTPTVSVDAEVSNDGQTYIHLVGLSLPGLAALGLAEANANVFAAYIRYQIKLEVIGGAPGNLAWTTLDLHVNFTHT